MNRVKRFLFWATLLCLGLHSTLGLAAQLHNLSFVQKNDRNTLYLSINGYFTYKLFFLSDPNRLVIDLKGASLKLPASQLKIQSALIQNVRSGQSGGQSLRLVFDLKKKIRVQAASWHYKGAIQGLKLELLGSTNSQGAAPIKPIKQSVLTQPVQAKPQLSSLQSHTPQYRAIQKRPTHFNQPLRDVVLVLDAGHGGKDPGAKGPALNREKNVVLAITLKLKKLIDRQPGMHAVLTRSGDYYVGLRERLAIARKYNGDIFISIHADAFNNPHSNGASVFALSQSGATSEAARWIAEKENYSELGGVNLRDLDDINGVVRSVLIDLSQTATINSSLHMGARVLGQLHGFTRLHNSRVEQARFMVLKSPDIPSILIETGFISNPREERNLVSEAYQNRLSQAIFQGIKAFFWENPPHGTRIEALTLNRVHLVKAGETLPSIAAQHHMSLSALQNLNHLDAHTKVRAGQTLTLTSSLS